MINVVKHLLSVNVWYIVVLCQFLTEVCLSDTGLSLHSYFEWLQTSEFAELFLYKLDVASKSGFGVPGKIRVTSFVSWRLLTFDRLSCTNKQT